ncbi:hypothetical protein [Peribacillus asahii]|uniref:hypothetical protein n=1 Tax=Peribacillus asahii TaxID=228899 RepID=UPI00207A7A51|nr:hypothetical protein [Peribacillus asahii]USK60270.1 hypothetical protein LIT37_02575 [Peribacillus asahii]
MVKRYQYKDSKSEVGFITSASKLFCSSCTCVRLSSNGFNLKSLIGSKATDEELLDVICNVWNVRADRKITILTKELSKPP